MMEQYGDMTALENKKPPIESIYYLIKRAKIHFMKIISLTFKNDKLFMILIILKILSITHSK
jgi:hypothetical protein